MFLTAIFMGRQTSWKASLKKFLAIYSEESKNRRPLNLRHAETEVL